MEQGDYQDAAASSIKYPSVKERRCGNADEEDNVSLQPLVTSVTQRKMPDRLHESHEETRGHRAAPFLQAS